MKNMMKWAIASAIGLGSWAQTINAMDCRARVARWDWDIQINDASLFTEVKTGFGEDYVGYVTILKRQDSFTWYYLPTQFGEGIQIRVAQGGSKVEMCLSNTTCYTCETPK